MPSPVASVTKRIVHHQRTLPVLLLLTPWPRKCSLAKRIPHAMIRAILLLVTTPWPRKYSLATMITILSSPSMNTSLIQGLVAEAATVAQPQSGAPPKCIHGRLALLGLAWVASYVQIVYN